MVWIWKLKVILQASLGRHCCSLIYSRTIIGKNVIFGIIEYKTMFLSVYCLQFVNSWWNAKTIYICSFLSEHTRTLNIILSLYNCKNLLVPSEALVRACSRKWAAVVGGGPGSFHLVWSHHELISAQVAVLQWAEQRSEAVTMMTTFLINTGRIVTTTDNKCF